tara:strand:+ start:552 stop:1022 length:471 start_codon:yes stop_codon:yes gene_type:complete
LAFADRVDLNSFSSLSNGTRHLDDNPSQLKVEKFLIKQMSSSEQESLKLTPELDSHRFQCRVCSFVYVPKEGIKKYGIPSGTPFSKLDKSEFRCPVCRERIEVFRDIGPETQVSGFEENLDYGFGVNKLTSGQKNVLIFGGLAFALACFLSLYSLN